MAETLRRPSWILRQSRAHPTWFVVALVCAAVVILEVASITNLFGLETHGSSPSAPTGPNLNPYAEKILAVESAITYQGPASGYLLITPGQDLCAGVCPKLPNESYAYSPPQDGLLIYYNITNNASVIHNLSLPRLSASGPISFGVQVMCCWNGLGGAYSEWVMGPLPLSPSVRIGFEAYVWTTGSIPYTVAGGYTLYANFTST